MVRDRGAGASARAWGCPARGERDSTGTWPLRRHPRLGLQLELCSPTAGPAGLAGARQDLNLPQAGRAVREHRKPPALQQHPTPWGQGPPKALRAELGAQGVTQHPIRGEQGGSLTPARQHGAAWRLARKSPAALPLHREN